MDHNGIDVHKSEGNINALRARAPLPRAPVPRPSRPQPHTPQPRWSQAQLQTVRQHRPYLERHALDTIMVDVCWQGFSAAKKVADLAETHEINVAPHNYNGHLSSFQALNFVASVSNVKITESDPDAVPIRDELFAVLPEIVDGQMRISTGPGWGTELNEKTARAHTWSG